MNILTFTGLFPNQVQPNHGIFVYQRLAHLAKRPGISVRVVAPVPYFPGWPPLPRWRHFAQVPQKERVGELEVAHPRYLLLPHSMPFHGRLMHRGARALVRSLHAQYRFDLIDAHYVYPDGFAAALLARDLGIPVVVSARGTDINLFPSFPNIRKKICWTLAQAAGAIAVSRDLQQKMIDLGLEPRKAWFIGNGIDAQRFQPQDREEARKRLHLPSGGRIAVAVGSLRESKGFQYLIPAAAQAAKTSPGLRVFIVGKGELRSSLESLIRSHNAPVTLVGEKPNEELAWWFSAADLSCLASSREGWPNVLLESMACGTPVLATNLPGVRDVVTSPELGILVEQDVAALARGLEEALKRRWDRRRLVEYARSRTWDDVAEQVEQCFSAVLGQERA